MRYIVLYLPFLLSSLLAADPVISYWVAWLGAFGIIYCVFSGKIASLPRDKAGKILFLHPLVLTHLIFAGYLAISSIFNFLDADGYYYFDIDPHKRVDVHYLELLAAAQRYYCLGHAAFITGIYSQAFRQNTRRQWVLNSRLHSVTLVWLSIIFRVLTDSFRQLSGLEQFAVLLKGLTMTAATMALALALVEKNKKTTLIAGALYAMSLSSALLSGFKEFVLVPVIILLFFLYPHYRRTVILFGPAAVLVLLTILPVFMKTFRQQAWRDRVNSEVAAREALAGLQHNVADIPKANWEFLTERISEIGMFTQYLAFVPERRDYYYLQILFQGVQNLIPRVLYPGKPATESVVMQRVYESGVIQKGSVVSAKPPLITDGYLSGGIVGVFAVCFLLGLFASWASAKAETLFGGYQLGTGLIFTGLFQSIWRPNCFEFLLNSLFWGVILMYLLAWIGRKIGWLVPARAHVPFKKPVVHTT